MARDKKGGRPASHAAATTTTSSSTKQDDNNNMKKKDLLDPNGTSQVARNSVPYHELKKQWKVVSTQNKSTNNKRQPLLKTRNKKTGTAVLRHEMKLFQATADADHATAILQNEAQAVGVLEAEHDLERTSALTQTALKQQLLSDNDEATARHIYDLNFGNNTTGLKYDRSGRYSVMYGKHTGQLAIMDNHVLSVVTEFSVRERIRAATFLHNFTLMATAQERAVFLYDHSGAEIHQLTQLQDPTALQFLPYHWLLVSAGRAGFIKYHDISTQQLVSQHATKLGSCQVLKQNPASAVIHAGHSNGTVTLWSPAQSTYLVKMLCHKGAAITDLVVDPTTTTQNHYMVTAGTDRQVRIWDLRMFRQTHSYYCTRGSIPTCLDISQKGILGVGHGAHVTFWSAKAVRTKVKDPYMHHLLPSNTVETLEFRPFEDVCGIGHQTGISSCVIPGAGEPYVDTSEYNRNPMQDAKQRKEEEVRALLDKLSPEMIALSDNLVGGMEQSRQDLDEPNNNNNNNTAKSTSTKQVHKKRGRSKIQTKLRRKQRNVVDKATEKLRQARQQEEQERKKQKDDSHEQVKNVAPAALKRFF